MPAEPPYEALCAYCGQPEPHRAHDSLLLRLQGRGHGFVSRADWTHFRRLLNAAYVGGTDHAGS